MQWGVYSGEVGSRPGPNIWLLHNLNIYVLAMCGFIYMLQSNKLAIW
jgi:hypothetical protein